MHAVELEKDNICLNTLILNPDGGHYFFSERPDETSGAIRNFLITPQLFYDRN
jgi:hypothetical protein